ncbi:MAG: LysM peptidoglycan-binding domain-containing protein [Anaerolineales bacterium]
MAVKKKPTAKKRVTGGVKKKRPVARAAAPKKPTGQSTQDQARIEAMKAQYTRPEPIAWHTVEDGETLSHIALRYYGNAGPSYYTHIYNANKAVIGDNPNVIKTGQRLEIPPKPEIV